MENSEENYLPREIKLLVIHCSATRCNVRFSVEQLRECHLQRGFLDIGYHFYITRDGVLHHCRPISEMGAHVRGFNRHSIGICYEGGLNEDGKPADTRTAAQRFALIDLLTIRTARGELGHVTIGMCGDLKFGRTVHSLIGAMSRYPGVEFVLISPTELRVPAYITQKLADDGIPFREVETMEEVMPELDVLYMTRVQKERFFNEADYIRLKDTYILDPDKLKTAKPDMAILHPLPRVNEISTKVDADPRAMYFEQVRNGRFVRMALISTLLEGLYED